ADDTATGMVFERFDASDFMAAVRRAQVLYARPVLWRAVRRRAMVQHFDWAHSAACYRACYAAALKSMSAART
ncbi:MAG: starch synthase, partial [Burkholderiales bacterium]|nr:starch synthase [Burkholderiales bacterium]